MSLSVKMVKILGLGRGVEGSDSSQPWKHGPVTRREGRREESHAPAARASLRRIHHFLGTAAVMRWPQRSAIYWTFNHVYCPHHAVGLSLVCRKALQCPPTSARSEPAPDVTGRIYLSGRQPDKDVETMRSERPVTVTGDFRLSPILFVKILALYSNVLAVFVFFLLFFL